MTTRTSPSDSLHSLHVRLLADQAFSRAAGAPLVGGNHITLLRDSTENYPAWEEAIISAQHHIHFENYIFADDATGRHFAALLTHKAAQGVKVRVLYDWLGGFSKTSGRLWRQLRAAGGEVRCFNPPRLSSPFGWTSRDHRKTLTIDGRLGFVSGLCVAENWQGNPAAGIPPWRDTGVTIRGPAVSDITLAFAQVWATCGSPLPANELAIPAPAEAEGNTNLRVIATTPSTSSLYRLDQLIAALARKSLWLTDPYYVGTPSYMHALCAAANDGVDVRLLVPSSTDIPALSPLSRAGYRPLIEAGVRVFEWNGPMIHAKTAVADGRWARVGSSNLNLASWLNNYELDVAVEDPDFAHRMETMYEQDLEQATEIVLTQRHQLRLSHDRPRTGTTTAMKYAGSTSRSTATAVRLSNTVALAMRQQRILGPTEATLALMLGALLLLVAGIAFYWPRVLAIPLALLCLWLAVFFIFRALHMLKYRRYRLARSIRRWRQQHQSFRKK